MNRHVVIFIPEISESIGLFVPQLFTYYDLRQLLPQFLERYNINLDSYWFSSKNALRCINECFLDEETMVDTSVYLINMCHHILTCSIDDIDDIDDSPKF